MSDNPEMGSALLDTFYGKPEPVPTGEPKEAPKDENPKVEEETPKEPAKAEASESDNEPETLQVIELDGEEVNLEDVRTWRKGHLMQSDYTKKTMDLAEERKAFEAERESERKALAEEKAKVSDREAMLEVLVNEEIDWDELWQNDPDEWKFKKDLADKREKALEELRASRNTVSPEVIKEEQRKLFESIPEWMENGKVTEKFHKDMELINTYAIKEGYTSDEFASLHRAHYLRTLFKAAKYDQLQEKGRKVKQERESIPVVTKPKTIVKKSEPKTMAQRIYGS